MKNLAERISCEGSRSKEWFALKKTADDCQSVTKTEVATTICLAIKGIERTTCVVLRVWGAGGAALLICLMVGGTLVLPLTTMVLFSTVSIVVAAFLLLSQVQYRFLVGKLTSLVILIEDGKPRYMANDSEPNQLTRSSILVQTSSGDTISYAHEDSSSPEDSPG